MTEISYQPWIRTLNMEDVRGMYSHISHKLDCTCKECIAVQTLLSISQNPSAVHQSLSQQSSMLEPQMLLAGRGGKTPRAANFAYLPTSNVAQENPRTNIWEGMPLTPPISDLGSASPCSEDFHSDDNSNHSVDYPQKSSDSTDYPQRSSRLASLLMDKEVDKSTDEPIIPARRFMQRCQKQKSRQNSAEQPAGPVESRRCAQDLPEISRRCASEIVNSEFLDSRPLSTNEMVISGGQKSADQTKTYTTLQSAVVKSDINPNAAPIRDLCGRHDGGCNSNNAGYDTVRIVDNQTRDLVYSCYVPSSSVIPGDAENLRLAHLQGKSLEMLNNLVRLGSCYSDSSLHDPRSSPLRFDEPKTDRQHCSRDSRRASINTLLRATLLGEEIPQSIYPVMTHTDRVEQPVSESMRAPNYSRGVESWPTTGRCQEFQRWQSNEEDQRGCERPPGIKRSLTYPETSNKRVCISSDRRESDSGSSESLLQQHLTSNIYPGNNCTNYGVTTIGRDPLQQLVLTQNSTIPASVVHMNTSASSVASVPRIPDNQITIPASTQPLCSSSSNIIPESQFVVANINGVLLPVATTATPTIQVIVVNNYALPNQPTNHTDKSSTHSSCSIGNESPRLRPLAPAPSGNSSGECLITTRDQLMPQTQSSQERLRNSRRKSYRCDYPSCDKTYFKNSHLKVHQRIHTGEKPFVCDWVGCDKKFARSDELSRHTRTHTGEKKYDCKVCGRPFMRSDHLAKHMKRHLGCHTSSAHQQRGKAAACEQ